MKVHFWGVRGSIPSPLTPQQIQAKINAVVQRIEPKDLESPDTRQKFLSEIPDWLYGTVGGNTPCVQIITKDGQEIILDAGSGIRVMGKTSPLPNDLHYSLVFSHYHWDHIQGFPFFDAVYNPNILFDVYSPVENTMELLAAQMRAPYYPVDFGGLANKFTFNQVTPGKEFNVSGLRVNCCKMSHPSDSYSYSFTEDGKKIVYATDIELSDGGFDDNDEKIKTIFYGADAVILDSQYTLMEATNKEKWGHSSFCYAIDFAVKMHIKNVYLFHHEPVYDDQKISEILKVATWYSDYVSKGNIKVFPAVEGQEIEL